MMMRRVVAALLLTLAIGTIYAQDAAKSAAPAANQPALAFDAASIRPSEQFDPQKMQAAMQAGKMPKFGSSVDGLRAEYNRMNLRGLIANAYQIKTYQVTGPDWIDKDQWDIAARMPEGSTADDAPKMLRALLAERFHLETQMATADHPVYALLVGKGGPKFKESAEKPVALNLNAELKPGEMKMDGPTGTAVVSMNPNHMGGTMNMGSDGRFTQGFDPQKQALHFEGTAVTMKALAAMMSQMMGGGPNAAMARPVIDETGLTGHYDLSIDMSFAGMMQGGGGPGGGGSGGPTQATDPGSGGGMGAMLFDAADKLGLKLDSRKEPLQQVVVVHLDKAPTDN